MIHSPTTRDFLKTFFRLFIPTATQNLFFNLIGMLDTLMIGQLGDASVAAVGQAGQFFFLLNLTLFGITGGASVFAAQYWGAQDVPNMRRVQGLSLLVSTGLAAVFAVIALGFPGWVMSIYTSDPEVTALGMNYLRTIGWSYMFTAVLVVYSAMVRSSGNTRLPMLVGVSFLLVNLGLNYSLIFGKFGLPVFGVQGSAIGTTICRVLECVTLITLIYRSGRSPAGATLRQLFSLDMPFALHHLRLIMLIFMNEFLWAMGVNLYNAMFARLGTQAYAAYSITGTIQGLGMFVMSGSLTTCGILVGHQIGSGHPEEAYRTGKRILFLSGAMSFVVGMVLIVLRTPLMELYQISDAARQDATFMLLVVGLVLWLRNLDGMLVVGIMRNGGDTKFSTFLDVGGIWLAGIPAVALAAFVLKLPVQWVYVATIAESLVKTSIGLHRFLSRKWIKNVTQRRPELALDPLAEG